MHDLDTQQKWLVDEYVGFRSVFSRLFFSVFLALIAFATSVFLLAQAVNNNSTTVRNRAIARQIVTQIDPFINEVHQHTNAGNRLQARFSLVVVKKSFEIFDQSLNAKIGLYAPNKTLLLETAASNLPTTLTHEDSWYSDLLPPLAGTPVNSVKIKTSTGYTLWYEPRIPPKHSKFLAVFNLFTGTMLLFIIISFVLWWIAKSITKRLGEMGEQMQRLGEGDFSVRVSEHGNDEIALLAHGFNQSAEKIERLISANKLLLAHASHEFRTPITRMRLQTEMLQMLGESLTDQQKSMLEKRTNAINKDLTGLNDMIESILLVSRLDAGKAIEAMKTVNLYELVATECQYYPESTLYGDDIFVQSQENLITHLTRNLINNALIHGKPPITVCVYGCQNGDDAINIPTHIIEMMAGKSQVNLPAESDDPNPNKAKKLGLNKAFFDRFNKKEQKPDMPTIPLNYAVLAVIDEGSGIPMDKRADIFSPFVRLKQEKKGSGLGLSLVSQIVEMHNGKILTDTWQGKTRFLAVLPVRQRLITKTSRVN